MNFDHWGCFELRLCYNNIGVQHIKNHHVPQNEAYRCQKATQAKTGVKKLSSKVLRRIQARKERDGDDDDNKSDKDQGEETIMETE
ncbi:hypothetical protein DYB37_008114 [Aphanomyces astaci]|uniref:Uncharacterized protein n=1 Tax=Aphanomyces astaci TaxID=112090 RepID=A0A3R7ARP8_APHAT|nr:hypothetical protein DYB35_002986 [Aphanomyces astaci]RHZ28940.1 hypothetical protein DYB37_008114 [Aphanomyces astaci]